MPYMAYRIEDGLWAVRTVPGRDIAHFLGADAEKRATEYAIFCNSEERIP